VEIQKRREVKSEAFAKKESGRLGKTTRMVRAKKTKG
jgi:hypothetical protein